MSNFTCVHTGKFFERRECGAEKQLPRCKMTERGKSFAGTVIYLYFIHNGLTILSKFLGRVIA